jgi:hypothetical protein
MMVSPSKMLAAVMPSARLALRISSCLAGLLFLSAALFSQTYTGRILGSVHDQQDAAIAGAKVVITDVQRGVSRTLATDESGDYFAPDLTPGEYKIRVEAKGFNSVERQNIVLEVAKDARVDFTLKPGDSTQVIIVTQEIPLLDPTSSSLGGTLSNKEINDLPLNGRNYENLLQLRPGVVRYPGGGFSTTSTNGLRAEDNAYLIDGLFNSEPFSGQSIINGTGIAGDSATILPIDAIQEFNVVENPPAEYGWKPGAIVNVAVKSGANDLHGTAYGFLRSKLLDARNYFNPVGQSMTPRALKQFGATAGGRIIKDKLFFFGGYEGLRFKVGNSAVEAVPSMVHIPLASSTCFFTSSGDCANSIPDAIADLQAAPAGLEITISPVSLALAGCTLGPPVTCNGKGFPTNNNPSGSLNMGFPNVINVDNAVGKIDYHPNERHTVSGLYFYGNNNGTVDDNGQVQPQWLTVIHTRAQVFGTNWTWVPNSRWVNEARFGYNRLYQPTFTADHNVPASSYGINTGVTNPFYGGLPIITILPFNLPDALGGFVWPKTQGPDTRFQIVDHLSYAHGKHALKFGGELHRDAFSGGAYSGGRGRIKFVNGGAFANGAGSTGLEDFFAGAPTVASVLIGDPTRHIHNWSYAGFLQDDWRISPRLTVNLGLRYELSTVVKEEHNLIGNFDPKVGDVQVGKQISGPYQANPHNFAPRLGFAWDPFGTGRTLIRAGGGLTYELVNWESFLAFNNTLGITSIPTDTLNGVQPGGGTISVGNTNVFPSTTDWNNGPIFPSGTVPVNCNPATDPPGHPCAIFAVDPKLVTPYVYSWNVNVQHAFTNNLSIQVAYVGNHGSNLVGIRDINQSALGSGWTAAALESPSGGPDPAAEQAGRPFTSNCPIALGGLGTGGPCFPFLGAVYQMANIYKSNYNGLQATLTGRNYHGLTFIAGYTYAHALDDVGANWDFGQGLGLPQDATHAQREYASSDFDMRHRFTLSLNYVIPGKKSFAQLLEGWQVNSIVSLYGAQPWGPTDSAHDISGTGNVNIAPAGTGIDRWDFFGNPADFKSGPTGIPFFAFGDPNMPAACITHAAAVGATPSLMAFGCYAKGSSVMIPPAFGTFGTMGRSFFRDSGFRNWDFSVAKNWKFKERLSAQFRVEIFNILNHPNFANPFGGQNGFGIAGFNDPAVPGSFGCGCATPDKAASNPVLGSGGSRAVQLGLKFIF